MAFALSSSVPNSSLAWSLGNGGRGCMHITFPFNMDWYNEQPCTRFKLFEHRKEPKGFQHEFIVLYFVDGSICRIERMGDPDARFDALSARGSVAHDAAQCYRPEHIGEARLDTSRVIARIGLPEEVDLLEVLKIVRAIHECDKTRNYTLQGFNCYFFSLAIQCCLTRLVARWEEMELNPDWISGLEVEVHSAFNNCQAFPGDSQQSSLLLQTFSLISGTRLLSFEHFSHCIRQFISLEEIMGRLSPALNNELWYSAMELLPLRLMLGEITNAASSKLMNHARYHLEVALEPTRMRSVAALLRLFASADAEGDVNHRPIKLHELSQYKRYSSTSSTRDHPGSSQTPKGAISQLDYHTASTDSMRTLTTTQWASIFWSHSQVLFLSFLHAMLCLWGINLFTGRPDPSPCIIIEDQLAHIVTELRQQSQDMPCYLDRLCQDIDMLRESTSAVWANQPWSDIQQAIVERLPQKAFSSHEERVLEATFLGDRQPKHITISCFQEHILKRIQLQARLVEQVKLGSSAQIQSKLREILAQIWTLIRDDNIPLRDVVHRARCNGCYQAIHGTRHKCLDCRDFDFCDTCFGGEHHGGTHGFYSTTEVMSSSAIWARVGRVPPSQTSYLATQPPEYETNEAPNNDPPLRLTSLANWSETR